MNPDCVITITQRGRCFYWAAFTTFSTHNTRRRLYVHDKVKLEEREGIALRPPHYHLLTFYGVIYISSCSDGRS